MTITHELIQEKLDNGEDSWFLKGGNRSRVKRFLRDNQLKHETLEKLWVIERLQRDIVATQKLPGDIIMSALEDSKLSVLKEILETQDLEQRHIDVISGIAPLFIMAWQHIPDILYKNGLYDQFLDTIFSDHVNLFDEKIQHAIVDVLRWKPDTMNDIAERVKQAKLINIDLLELLAKYIYFSDEIIKTIKQALIDQDSVWGPKHVDRIMDILVAKNHCSVNMKASYLLLK